MITQLNSRVDQSYFSPLDMHECAEIFGAACGHGALAAAFGVPVVVVMDACFENRGGWLNIPMMQRAIRSAGRSYLHQRDIPDTGTGVAMVQWLGPWMNPNLRPHVRCAYRHWIAFQDGQYWDSNLEFWCSSEVKIDASKHLSNDRLDHTKNRCLNE